MLMDSQPRMWLSMAAKSGCCSKRLAFAQAGILRLAGICSPFSSVTQSLKRVNLTFEGTLKTVHRLNEEITCQSNCSWCCS